MAWPRFTRRAALERERRAEMQAHLDLAIEQLIDRGVPREEARRQAQMRFGNVRVKLEEAAEMSRLSLIDSIGRDLRYAVRVLRRTPAFTLTTVVTLGLAIGANSAVFSLADAILLRPLPYPDADRLAVISYTSTTPNGRFKAQAQDGATWEAVRDHVPALESAVSGSAGGANLVVGNGAAFVRQQRVSAGFFRVLGVPPARGREFLPDEDRPKGPPATILSHELWQRVFGGDEQVIGQRVLLRGEPHAVVGVMPSGFVSSTTAELWTPLRPSTSGEGGGTNYQIFSRLVPGATWAQAAGQLEAASAEAFRLNTPRAGTTRVLGVEPLRDAFVEGMRDPIVMLLAAVGTVLLIACVNIAALLLARGSQRSKEIATRMALGSGRGAVVRQLMVEAAVIALAGGALGLIVGAVGLESLKSLGDRTYPEWQRVSLDLRIVSLTMAVSIATSVLFGLAPALQASRLDVQVALADGGSRSIAGGARHWPRRALVIAEVALSVVLLVTAGVLIRTFVSLRALDPGFDPKQIVTASVSLQDARYATAEGINRLFDESLSRLGSSPGVISAAVSLELPYNRLLNLGTRFVDEPAEASARTANVSYVTAGFFRALGIPLQRGRLLEPADRAGAPAVVVVNEAFARVYSSGREVVGRRIRVAGAEREIVGVSASVKQIGSFSAPGMDQGPLISVPSVYLPAAQTSDGTFRTAHTWFAPVWIVRAADQGAASQALVGSIAAVDSLLPVSEPKSMSAVMADAMAVQRLMMTLVGTLAAAAALLAAIGIHGLIAHAVAERRREFGIRIALGASVGRTIRGVAMDGVTLAVAGAIAGGVLSIAAVRLVESVRWGVSAHDPLTYAAVGAFVLIVAAVASLVPALRLLRLDPAEVLK